MKDGTYVEDVTSLTIKETILKLTFSPIIDNGTTEDLMKMEIPQKVRFYLNKGILIDGSLIFSFERKIKLTAFLVRLEDSIPSGDKKFYGGWHLAMLKDMINGLIEGTKKPEVQHAK